MPRLPRQLVEEVLEGRVVAFVGAGFSMPRAPSWSRLLQLLGEKVRDDEKRETILGLAGGTAEGRALEAAAQMIRDELGDDEFRVALEEVLQRRERGSDVLERGSDVLGRRIEWLRGIPFRAILTTNFDGYIPDVQPPSPEVYQDLLRADRAWWQGDWSEQPPRGTVVALHGSLSFDDPRVVFTKRDYLQLVHGRSDYRPFLRAMLMTNTVLFLGFSFTDAYINELRAEVEALFDLSGIPGTGRPLAWAVMDGATRPMRQYLREHEGIEVIPISSDEPRITEEFNEVLRSLHEQTNPVDRVAAMVQGRTIAWIDPEPHNNGFGYQVLKGGARGGDGSGGGAGSRPGSHVVEVVDTEHWRDRLRGERPDVVITHWGHGQAEQGSRALDVLHGLRTDRDLPQAPVIVFGEHNEFVAENRRRALAHGATSFESQWAGLFRELERLLAVDPDAA